MNSFRSRQIIRDDGNSRTGCFFCTDRHLDPIVSFLTTNRIIDVVL